jgi:hypothetical protein
MADRDAARVVLGFPDMDYDGDGAVDVASGFDVCIFDGPTWSGFDKPATETTATCDALDAWGNIIRTYRGGTIIDNGTLTMGVDWDITDTDGGKEYGAFMSRVSGNFTVSLPANIGETTGPVITIPGVITNFTPQGTVLGTGDEARWAASIVLQISGALTFTAAV